jgi:hypothetical protein
MSAPSDGVDHTCFCRGTQPAVWKAISGWNRLGPPGFERGAESSRNAGILASGDAQSDAPGIDDAQLARLLELWPTLPADARRAILDIAGQAALPVCNPAMPE